MTDKPKTRIVEDDVTKLRLFSLDKPFAESLVRAVIKYRLSVYRNCIIREWLDPFTLEDIEEGEQCSSYVSDAVMRNSTTTLPSSIDTEGSARFLGERPTGS